MDLHYDLIYFKISVRNYSYYSFDIFNLKKCIISRFLWDRFRSDDILLFFLTFFTNKLNVLKNDLCRTKGQTLLESRDCLRLVTGHYINKGKYTD